MKKRFLSMLLAACMVLTLMPATAFATDNVVADSGDSTLCEHHTQHDADCGYVLAQEAVEGTEEIPCDMECTDTDDDGEINHDDDCAYTPATEGTSAVTGTPCGYVCEECSAEDNAPVPLTYEQVVELFEALQRADSITAETTGEDKQAAFTQLGEAFSALEELSEGKQQQFLEENEVLYLAAMALNDAITGNTAQTYIDYGDFSVTTDSGAAPAYADNVLTLGNGTYTVSGTTTTNKIVVSAGSTANITLGGLTVDVSSTANACAFDVGANANVNITLAADSENTLKSGSSRAGLHVPEVAAVTIDGTGTLSAYGGSTSDGAAGAGIGGNNREKSGTITVNGGTVNAYGAGNSAGMGGGTLGSGNTVIIHGGTVNASASWRGSGIGGGFSGGNSNLVTITGGTVHAIGASGYSAIGASALKNDSNVNVQLYTLTVMADDSTALANSAVSVLSTTEALGYTYGMDTVKTDDNGKLYVYLPAGKTDISVTVGNSIYTGSVTANAATLTHHTHCGCGGTTGIGNHTSHSDISYTAVDNANKFPGTSDEHGNFYITAGSYYLTEDIVLTQRQNIAEGTQVNICLNGHSISMTASGSDNTLFNNKGTMRICNCGTAGELRCTGGNAVDTVSGGSTLFYGGKITGCKTGVIIYGDSGAGSFTMYGGEITGNSGDQIGGVQNAGSFTMYGGSVTNNSGSIAGGIANSGTLTIGGEVTISGNKVGTQDSNLVLVRAITVSAAQSSPIGVTVLNINDVSSTTGVFTGTNSAAYLDSFKADDSRYFVALTNDNALQLKAPVSAADYAVDAASPTDYEINGTTLTIKSAKGAAWWSANGNSYLDYAIYLGNDIDVSAFLWSPVGNGNMFSGTLDGQGHSISGLTINSNENYAGLLKSAGEARIQNLCIASGSVKSTFGDAGDLYVSGIVGYAVNSTILNCCNHATVYGKNSGNQSYDNVNVGGITGVAALKSNGTTTIRNCFNTGSVTAIGAVGNAISGGIAGKTDSNTSITNCYNTGSIKSDGSTSTKSAGAISGFEGQISNCYSLTGCVTAGTGGQNGTVLTSEQMKAATGAPSALIDSLNGWVNTTASSEYYTWVADNADTPINGGYPVFGAVWAAPQAPTITAGANQSTPSSASSDLIVTSSANFADFQRVEVGKQGETPVALAEANYTVASGSTVVTLKNSYLKTLSAGTYTLNIVSATGTASTTFTITSGGGNNSNNGGGSSTAYYTITATAGAGGSISTGTYVSVREGDSAGFTMTPDKGYIIADVKVDGKSVGAVASYTFTNVRANHTIEVTFKVSGGHVNPQTGVAFEDVSENDWFYDAVYNTVENGWFAGTSNATFAPNASTTRGMIATVLHRMENEPTATAASGFEDVASGAYYFKGVNWAQEHKIVSGYGNGKFGPQDNITREQMAAILYRYAAFKGYDVTETTSLDSFTDAGSVSAYALDPMKWAVANGLITGKGNGILDPKGQATRAQVAAILTRFDELFAAE